MKRRRHALATRQTWGGAAARWALRQGLVSLGLHVAGMVAFIAAATLIALPLGLATAGVLLWYLEMLTREDHP